MAENTNNANGAPTNGRASKAEIRSSRLKYNGSNRRLDGAERKLDIIEKQLERKGITSTQRKTLQAKRVDLLAKRDEARIDIDLSRLHLNTYLDRNNAIHSAERIDSRKEGNIKLRVDKLSFKLRNSFKGFQLPAESRDAIVTALQNDNKEQFRAVLSMEIQNHPTIRVKLPQEGDEAGSALLTMMMSWFRKRLNVQVNGTADHALVPAAQAPASQP